MIKDALIKTVKKAFGIQNLTLTVRRKQQDIQKIFYRKKYSADDIISMLKDCGVQPGRPLLLHTAMHNFYNYKGTADELIDKLIEFLGEEGTLCMCAFPKDKYDTKKIFDIEKTPSAAGYLTELFRKRPGVKRSMNQLHSVCAFGKDADYIVSDHQNSMICFDEHSPFYKIAELQGYSVSLGMPKWYVGTGEHVCEAILYDECKYFNDKYFETLYFTYINKDGIEETFPSLTNSSKPYYRSKKTALFDQNFDKRYFRRVRLSNIWITVSKMDYLVNRLVELAREGKSIYEYPRYKYERI